MPRSVRIAKHKLEEVKKSLIRKGFRRQQDLAEAARVDLSTVNKFLNGKNVDNNSATEICHQLDYTLSDIIDSEEQVENKPEIKNGDDHNSMELEYPEGKVPLNSPFYLKRSFEESYYRKIEESYSLLRIKAIPRMGKTSLITRILNYSQTVNHKTFYFDFDSLGRESITNLDQILQELCICLTEELTEHDQQQDNNIKRYWKTYSSIRACTVFFEKNILPSIKSSLVLSFDKVDKLFPYQEVAEDFLTMLRSWHEKSKDSSIWQKLKIIVAYSTDVYVKINVHNSPFNVGFPIELLPFSLEEVKTLTKRHGLNAEDYDDQQFSQLLELTGGHCYLIRLFLYHLAENNATKEKFSQMLEGAVTEAGIYGNYLRSLLVNLRQKPDLMSIYTMVVNSSVPVGLESKQFYQLQSMGLVKKQDDKAIPWCNLYRDYFLSLNYN